MKRLLALLLVIVLCAFSLSACKELAECNTCVDPDEAMPHYSTR